jgi:arsenite methyltransferase
MKATVAERCQPSQGSIGEINLSSQLVMNSFILSILAIALLNYYTLVGSSPGLPISICLLQQLTSPRAIEPSERDRRQKPGEVVKAMNLQPGDVVVDLGAGEGYFTRRFALAVGSKGRAIGADIDDLAVQKMKDDARRLQLANYEARKVSPDDASLPPESADVIFLCDTYHHIENRVDYFARLRQALKSGGRLLIVDMEKAYHRSAHSIEKEVVVDELKQAGYQLHREFDLLLPRQFFLEFIPTKSRPQPVTHESPLQDH